ncbi:RNA polymerase sigma factor [Sphingosinicella soli]|uniref:RNA polymerase sigma-70 factor (ECF subfamily) n=1 Tax=Sphingosinicella soli TaxID=333708 RepID=A0A7W7B292_9SPHN|nr:RNA polymerase sigma factor [Sphingosinicella soli]MBB4632651.1 RNA polymerase sigma-70 factor (ECF subfamily) [Sphingosinicella soli]
MNDENDTISAWLAREIVPHERDVRNWLSRRWYHVLDIEDVIQEAYCRLASLASVDHIECPRSYFFRTVHTVATDLMRRAGIVNFTSMTQIDLSNVVDSGPLADRALEAKQELERVNRLLAELSETHRRAIELRRVEGLSRRETAERLQVSEDALKKYVERGMHRILKIMAEQDERVENGEPDNVEREAEVIGKQRRH